MCNSSHALDLYSSFNCRKSEWFGSSIPKPDTSLWLDVLHLTQEVMIVTGNGLSLNLLLIETSDRNTS